MATIYDCERRSSKELYDEIDKDFNDMTICMEKAAKLAEEGKIDDAVGMYEFAISVIDKALSKPIESPSKPDIEWEKAYAKVMKMRKSRKEALSKISDVQSRPHPDSAAPPPSYEEAMASSQCAYPVAGPSTSTPVVNTQPYLPSDDFDSCVPEKNTEKLYPDITPQLRDLQISGNHEIIYSHNNVRIYFIAPDGRVSSTMEPDTLIIGRMEDLTHGDILDDNLMSIVDDLTEECKGEDKKQKHGHHRHRHHRRHRRHHGESSSTRNIAEANGQIYLRVGSWIYPLIPGISPCFRSDYGAFILPDIHSQVEGAAIGLILPPTADSSVYELLTSILFGVVGSEDLRPKPPVRTRKSDRVDRHQENRFSTSIVRGASYLANNLVRGADSASRFIDSAAPHIKNRITPTNEPPTVNPTLKTSVNVAKSVTSTAATASTYLASKLGSAASSLGQYLAPHIQRQGTRLLASTTRMSQEEASKKMEALLDVSSGAVQGIATVYSGLENSASILGKSLANNTVQIIQHKYGQSAGDVTSDAISTAGNLYTVHGNYKVFKPKGVVKTVAKGAVRGALAETAVGENEQQQTNGVDGSFVHVPLLPPAAPTAGNASSESRSLSSGPSSHESASYGFKVDKEKTEGL